MPSRLPGGDLLRKEGGTHGLYGTPEDCVAGGSTAFPGTLMQIYLNLH
jgi:hypothetical protein